MPDYAGINRCPECGPYLDEHGIEVKTKLVDVSLVYPYIVVVTSMPVPTDFSYSDLAGDEEFFHRTAHFLAGEFGVEVDIFYAGIQELSVTEH
jgi:hypothetical protein